MSIASINSSKDMGAAIGLASLIIVMSIFAPQVLNAMENFLLAFFGKATVLLQGIELRPHQ
jgi:hypothetical protein